MRCYYNFQDLLQIEIEQKNLDLITNYEHYFSQIKSNHSFDNAHYQIKEYNQFILPEKHLNVGNVYFGFNGGVCFPNEKYALLYDGRTLYEYTTVANRATNLYMQILLVNQAMSLVHCAGMEINGKGLIFPAFGGAGKTMLVSEMRKKDDFRLFGDDYVTVDGHANMYAYLSDFSIYDEHIHLFPKLKGSPYHQYLSDRKKKEEFINSIPGNRYIRKVLNLGRALIKSNQVTQRRWDLDYIKVPVTEVLPEKKLGTRTKLFASVFLSRYSGDKIKAEKISLERLVSEIMGILNVEFRYGLIYLHMLSGFGGFDLSLFGQRQKEVLESCFSKLDLYRVWVPVGISPKEYTDYMSEFINDLTK